MPDRFLVVCTFLGHFLLNNGVFHFGVDCASLTMNPSSITVTADGSTTSPEVTIECSPDSYSGISVMYYMYLKRNNITFADVYGNNLPSITQNAPSDIRNNPPVLEGGIFQDAGSSYLRARLNSSLLGCLGGASYQCQLSYKPNSGQDSPVEFVSKNLTVEMVPGNVNISLYREGNLVNNYLNNLSMVTTDQRLVFTCTGNTGKLPSTSLKWFWKYENQFNFIEFSANPGEGTTISESQTSYTCPYSRTSTLRLRVLATMTSRLMFRCQTTPMTATNTFNFIAYSEEFHLTHDNRPNQGLVLSTTIVRTIMVPVLAAILQNQLLCT